MKRSLDSRLSVLEEQCRLRTPIVRDFGWLKNVLPPDYNGEREFVVVSRRPTASEHIFWCEFEERAAESGRSGNRPHRMKASSAQSEGL